MLSWCPALLASSLKALIYEWPSAGNSSKIVVGGPEPENGRKVGGTKDTEYSKMQEFPVIIVPVTKNGGYQ